jgi:hypothetical protein
MDLKNARRIASDIVRADHPSLKVVGVAAASSGAKYTEIVLSIANCHAEPCRITIGVQRDVPEATFRAAVEQQLREHVRELETAASSHSHPGGYEMAAHLDDDETGEGPAIGKVDDLASVLDDLSVTLDELKDNPQGIDQAKLDEVKRALEHASDVVDDIEDQMPNEDRPAR